MTTSKQIETKLGELLQESNLGEVIKSEDVQELWSGYGKIQRLQLDGKNPKSVIIKKIEIPGSISHPRGWNTPLSHKRKMKSYQVESNWYANYNYIDDACRIPKCLGSYSEGETHLILMEDLALSGYSKVLDSVEWTEIETCIKWLAHFHARFMSVSPQGLWSTGSYWHLETRPDELNKITCPRLKYSAGLIDRKLEAAKFKTIIHGDAKLANFCFSDDLTQVAAVDFQYVGAGRGMKDLAYFISSCMDSDECKKHEHKILDTYFLELKHAVDESHINFKELESEWRQLYPYAWADFYRFLKGWSPEHWKVHAYSEEISRKAQSEILNNLTATAQDAALAAGEVIKSTKEFTIQKKNGNSLASSVVTEADFKAQEAILKGLNSSIEAYDFGLLTEELKDDGSRQQKAYFWCIDPLDGTLAFSENRPGYAVSIALVERDGTPVIGVVYDPVEDNLYSASIGGGSFKNGKSLNVSMPSSSRPKLFADLSLKADPKFDRLKQEYEVCFGAGAVMNSIWCIENSPASYIKYPKEELGGGSLWDFAAVSLIVNEAGGHAHDYYGDPIDLNRKDSTYLNDKGIMISSKPI
ncbi:MAG: DUF1679 domain-containing protein [Bacteriovoracaceae bacterium]|nr:DUF1679 domain-containing protein [Bacteriovoracaceae bacterium]